MKRFLIFLLLGILFIGGIIYFAFSSDKSISITYIKFKINPTFIIGLNDDDVVKIYNPMNEDAKIFNLTMFNNKSIDKTMEIILNKLDENNYLDDRQIDITVISKNPKKIDYYYQKIKTVINNYSDILILNNQEASYDELYAYSNEIAYDVKSSLENDKLISIAQKINDNLNNYINNKINQLDTNKLNNEEILSLYNEKLTEGYFNNYIKDTNFDNDMNVDITDINYSITFNEDLMFNISIDLGIEYINNVNMNNKTYTILEDYNFIYENGEIKNLKTIFYRYA